MIHVALAALLLSMVAPPELAEMPTPVIGPCDGCELALEGLPAAPPAVARIASADEPGEALRVHGTVTDAAGTPRPGVILYAHQTDATGHYPDSSPAQRHGRLRGWARTDTAGRYAFLTVRPGAYPGRDGPQHIHLVVVEPGCALYYIDDVLFRDDPRVTPGVLRRLERRGGSGLTDPVRRGGGWEVRRDVVLGERVPGYPSCDAAGGTGRR